MGYSGWKNWETWHTALLIDNEEGSYYQARDLAREGVGVIKLSQKMRFAENATRKYMEEIWPEDRWEAVDWDEIYEHYQE